MIGSGKDIEGSLQVKSNSFHHLIYDIFLLQNNTDSFSNAVQSVA